MPHLYLLCLFPHLKSLVLEIELKTHTKMMAWLFPYKKSCVCIAFHSSRTFRRPSQYPSEQGPELQPTISQNLFPPLIVLEVLFEAKYFTS
jgi:hypothetical protein